MWRRRLKSEFVLLRCLLPRIEVTSYETFEDGLGLCQYSNMSLSAVGSHHVVLFVSKALAKQTFSHSTFLTYYLHHTTMVRLYLIQRVQCTVITLYRHVMKRKRSPCSIASAKPKRLSWASVPVETNGPRWPAHVKACVNVNAGEVKYYARSAERCPRSRMVRTPYVSAQHSSPTPLAHDPPPTSGIE